jgi:carboxylate-amine ligase
MPDEFATWANYQRHVDVLVDAGVIEDATKLWWDLRPSARYPTLEMRASDICTRLDDTMTIAALFQSLLSMLFRLGEDNQRWRIYSRMLISENTWRAQRYGTAGSLIDFGKGELVPVLHLTDEIVELVREDAEALDCLEEVEHALEIARDGTSAQRQLNTYTSAIADGASEREALIAVVDDLIAETLAGT